MTERGERNYRWAGGRVAPDAEADGGMPQGVADPSDAELLDWRDMEAIGREQTRIYRLWRQGRVGNRAAKTGMALLCRLADTSDRVAALRMAELEELVARLEAQVALRHAPPRPVRQLA